MTKKNTITHTKMRSVIFSLLKFCRGSRPEPAPTLLSTPTGEVQTHQQSGCSPRGLRAVREGINGRMDRLNCRIQPIDGRIRWPGGEWRRPGLCRSGGLAALPTHPVAARSDHALSSHTALAHHAGTGDNKKPSQTHKKIVKIASGFRATFAMT